MARLVKRRIENSTAAILAAGACYILAGWALGFRPFDDTFITFRYARNIASGAGFVFNAGERVLGTTSPAWALFLAAASRLGAPIAGTAVAVSLAADVLTAWLIARLLRRFGASALVAGAGGIIFLSTFDALSLGRSGMETSVFTAAVFGAMAAAAYSRTALAGALAGLAALIRPEGLAVVPIVMAAAARPRDALIAAAAAAAVVLPWWDFATWYFGSPIPQSVMAKAAVSRAPQLAAFNWANVRLFLVAGQYGGDIFKRSYWSLAALRTLLVLVGTVAAIRTGRRAALLLAAFPIGVFAALAIANAFTWFPWYYAVFHAGFALLAAFGLQRALASKPSGARLVLAVSAILVIAQIGVALRLKLPADRNDVVRGYFEAAAAIDPSGQPRVAALEIGVVGWSAPQATIIDLEGLVTPSAVGRRQADIVRETLPDYLMWRTNNAAGLIEGLSRDGWLSAHYDRIFAMDYANPSERYETYRRRTFAP